MNRTAVTSEADISSALRAAVRDAPPLRPLEPYEYAIGHALFEARSDQRTRLTDWLVSHVTGRPHAPTRVLSIGCGDGSVDVRFAAGLATGGRQVDYLGIEPHGPSSAAFLARLTLLAGVDAAVTTETFADSGCERRFDVVLAVHSLYYVDDLAETLRRAHALLAPGGVLVVLHAPCEPLNVYVRELAPGRRQGFSDEVVATLRAAGHRPEITRIDNRLDLSETGDPDADRALLSFTVQAHLPATLARVVRTALTGQALPGPGLVVSHPVDAIVVRRS